MIAEATKITSWNRRFRDSKSGLITRLSNETGLRSSYGWAKRGREVPPSRYRYNDLTAIALEGASATHSNSRRRQPSDCVWCNFPGHFQKRLPPAPSTASRSRLDRYRHVRLGMGFAALSCCGLRGAGVVFRAGRYVPGRPIDGFGNKGRSISPGLLEPGVGGSSTRFLLLNQPALAGRSAPPQLDGGARPRNCAMRRT